MALRNLLLLSAAGLARASVPPPSFDVSLDAPPARRYRGAVRLVLETHGAENTFAPVFAHWNATFWHQFPPAVFRRAAAALRGHFPETFEELRGVSQELSENGIGASAEYLSAWVYRHELQHAVPGPAGLPECTGIVVQSQAGAITHGRNEDLDPRFARNLTLSLRFLRGEEVVLHGTDWYWFTAGLRTAMRPGVASVSGNFRFASPRPLETVLSEIDGGTMPDMLLFRHALLSADTYAGVLRHLAMAPVATPSYYVVAGTGPGEGAVVSRAPGNGSIVTRLGSPGIVGAPPEWALVQTNYELWEEDHADDPRRTVATNLLATYGQGLGASALGLYAACSTYPVHNEDTAYTTIMSAGTGEFSSFVREAMAPAPLQKRCWQDCCRPQSLPFGARCTAAGATELAV